MTKLGGKVKTRYIANYSKIRRKIEDHDLWELKPLFPELKQLKKTGGGDYIMLCPFHTEESPSFTWHIRKRNFNCYGCGYGGNLIWYYAKRKCVSEFVALIALSKFFNIKIVWKNKQLQ